MRRRSTHFGRMFRFLAVAGLFCGVLATFGRSVNAQPNTDVHSAASAADFLQDSLDRSRSGAKLLRRTTRYLAIDQNRSGLQLAFVLDGTDSMGPELEEMKNNLFGIEEGLRGQSETPLAISIAAVVYRDSQATSGAVSLPVPEFESNVETVVSKLKAVGAETGAPYFDEQVDVGLYAALTQLNWSEDSTVDRWIILCGDAPPYPEGTEFRKHKTDELIEIAKKKGVKIYTLYVDSTDDSAGPMDAAEIALRPETAAFFSKIADATGGKSRQLWDRAQVLAELQQKPITVAVPAISAGDIAAAAKERRGTLTIDVLPLATATGIVFESNDAGVLLGVGLQHALQQRGVNANGPGSVSPTAAAEIAKLKPTADGVAKLPAELSSEYVLWGSLATTANRRSVTFRLFERSSSKLLAELTADLPEKGSNVDSFGTPLSALFAAAAEKAAETDRKAIAAVSKQTNKPLSNDARAHRAIASGLFSLEQAATVVDASLASQSAAATVSTAEREAGTAAVVAASQSAIQVLKQAAAFDPSNPLPKLLLSQAYFNLAAVTGDGEAESLHYSSLQEAYDSRSALQGVAAGTGYEIEALYALLVQKDVPAAVVAIEAGLKVDGLPSATELRLRWMLAGIYLGDWGTRVFAPKLVDPAKAREQIIQIVAGWPNHPAAQFYSSCLKAADGGPVDVPLLAARQGGV